MGYKLCIAEKPSVARDIARVIGANNHKNNGYIEGNNYIVTWAIGHLVGLAEPHEYGFVKKERVYSDEKQRAYDELPLIPDEFKLIVLEATKNQFNIVKGLMHRQDVDYIIDCGDMGAEGHILQWLIRVKAGCLKPVKRFCATSMTDEAIMTAMNNLRPITDFDNIIKGELCKKKADWILGMSMSRVMSLKYNAGINVGRVQSPTLYFVVKRFLEANNFKVTNYFTICAELVEGIKIYWSKDTENLFHSSSKDEYGRVLDKSLVDKACTDILSLNTGVVIELSKQKKAIERPQLYDITELQRQANVLYGYSAAVTLATAQSLYETHKLLSYPRTDSRYITTDLVSHVQQFVEALGKQERYAEVAGNLLSVGLNIDKRIVDDSKVTDHHAIIPTNNISRFDRSKLSPTSEENKKGVTAETLYNILDLVLCRLLVSLSKPYIYEHTGLKVKFDNGFILSATGNVPLSPGWRACQDVLLGKGAFDIYDPSDTSEDNQVFPEIKNGQTISVRDCMTVPKKTTPPKLHTEATLLTAMENAGAAIENGAILKGKGIGTQATRAEIITKLFDSGVIESLKKGKTNYLQPTPKGLSVIRVLPQDLYSPKITADWESLIAEIADGKKTENDFMNMFIPVIKDKVKEVKDSNTGISFKKEKEVHGVCPWCKSDLYRYDKKDEKGKVIEVSFYCATKCEFSIKTNEMVFDTFLKRPLTVCI